MVLDFQASVGRMSPICGCEGQDAGHLVRVPLPCHPLQVVDPIRSGSCDCSWGTVEKGLNRSAHPCAGMVGVNHHAGYRLAPAATKSTAILVYSS